MHLTDSLSFTSQKWTSKATMNMDRESSTLKAFIKQRKSLEQFQMKKSLPLSSLVIPGIWIVV